MWWTDRVSNAGRDKELCSPKCPGPLLGLPSLLFSEYWSQFLGGGMRLTSLPHLVPRLRMSGAIPLFPVYELVV